MNRRGGKREGAGRKKSPALAKITREINKKHWKANHQYIYLENRVFSTWRKVRAEGTFVNDSNFASWLLARELPYIIQYIYTFSHSCPLSRLLHAKSINFDSIGKMQKCSRFSDCKSEPM